MLKRISVLCMVLFLLVALAGCGGGAPASVSGGGAGSGADSAAAGGSDSQQQEIVVQHPLGETRVRKNPQKVVVFDFGVLDTLDKLGINVTGVPQANIPTYLQKYKSEAYVNVGSLPEPDFEKISEIAPDLIIISGRQREAYEELAELGPTIYMAVDPSRYVDSFKENMRTLGKIFGKEKEVEQELAKIDQMIADLRNRVTQLENKNALVILVNDRSISAFGPGSRFGLIYDVFGFTPIDPNIEVSTHGMNISFEYLAEKNPDYLFVIDRGAVVGGEGVASAQQTLDNELVKMTKAYKNGNIVYLDANYWYLSGGGLVSVSEMIQQVANSLR
ncbi:MAG: ABC transporter [Bacillota bacterium]|nr:MAG: ABC transporter [Bacillota bacterium]